MKQGFVQHRALLGNMQILRRHAQIVKEAVKRVMETQRMIVYHALV